MHPNTQTATSKQTYGTMQTEVLVSCSTSLNLAKHFIVKFPEQQMGDDVNGGGVKGKFKPPDKPHSSITPMATI